MENEAKFKYLDEKGLSLVVSNMLSVVEGLKDSIANKMNETMEELSTQLNNIIGGLKEQIEQLQSQLKNITFEEENN